jgi:hypothetical protein
MFTKVGSTDWSYRGFHLAGLYGFILAGTDIRRNSYMKLFWATKIQFRSTVCLLCLETFFSQFLADFDV